MIEIDGLRVNKKGRTICDVQELQIFRGERVSILGPNGSGKTTLLRVMSGLEVDFEGVCRVEASWKDRVYVHQSPYLFRGTVLFNVTYGLCQRGIDRAECDRLALHWLRRFGLHEIASDRVAHLSGGERRRIALLRAIILRPRLLLLDEPMADMDEKGAAVVAAALADLKETTVVVASPATSSHSFASRSFRLQPATKLPLAGDSRLGRRTD